MAHLQNRLNLRHIPVDLQQIQVIEPIAILPRILLLEKIAFGCLNYLADHVPILAGIVQHDRKRCFDCGLDFWLVWKGSVLICNIQIGPVGVLGFEQLQHLASDLILFVQIMLPVEIQCEI